MVSIGRLFTSIKSTINPNVYTQNIIRPKDILGTKENTEEAIKVLRQIGGDDLVRTFSPKTTGETACKGLAKARKKGCQIFTPYNSSIYKAKKIINTGPSIITLDNAIIKNNLSGTVGKRTIINPGVTNIEKPNSAYIKELSMTPIGLDEIQIPTNPFKIEIEKSSLSKSFNFFLRQK